jgi:phage antirepressor YoqD-like protein
MNQIFKYQGNDITFQIGNGDVMVNATEMARPFGKRAGEWIRLPSTQNYLDALEAMGKSHRSRLVYTENGVGTWLHEDMALEFARWLSPRFAIWCNDRVKELMKYGFTASQEKLDQLVNNPDLLISLASQLKKEREEKLLLQNNNAQLQDTITKQAPRVRFSEAVEASSNSILIGDLAKVLYQKGVNIGQNRLFKFLRGHGYLCSKGDLYNTPSQRAMEMGLFEIKKNLIIKPNGTTLVTSTTMITGKGQIYFTSKFLTDFKRIGV